MQISTFETVIIYLEQQLRDAPQVGMTRELVDFHYTIAHPYLNDLHPDQPWADIEFVERIGAQGLNPGKAWTQHEKVWKSMMEADGKFSYTYSERMAFQLDDILGELDFNTLTREAFLGVWNPTVDSYRLSKRRVPCTLGYQFFIREGQLVMTYLQRSCNFYKHYQNDVWLARSLQEWVADKLKIKAGFFSHWVGSLHVFLEPSV